MSLKPTTCGIAEIARILTPKRDDPPRIWAIEPASNQTVANKLDVAVRRHVRTQIAQDGARLTELRMDEAGIEYVEVSSHAGARPSHQEWEGRVYSRNGRRTVGGVTYEDFRTACHWSDVADDIYGANCRHAHGPWIPGTPPQLREGPQAPQRARQRRGVQAQPEAARDGTRHTRHQARAEGVPENLRERSDTGERCGSKPA